MVAYHTICSKSQSDKLLSGASGHHNSLFGGRSRHVAQPDIQRNTVRH